MSHKIRIVLADDHSLIRIGITGALAEKSEMIIVGQAKTGDETIELCRALKPDLLLLDLSMPGPSPLEIINHLRTEAPDIKILVLTAYDDDAYVRAVVPAGVSGYILKDEATEAVVDAIRTVMRGAVWFSRSIANKLFLGKEAENPLNQLTEREREVLSYVALGLNNAQIAQKMHLADQTIRNYASRVYNKLGVSSRGEAIVWARTHGLK